MCTQRQRIFLQAQNETWVKRTCQNKATSQRQGHRGLMKSEVVNQCVRGRWGPDLKGFLELKKNLVFPLKPEWAWWLQLRVKFRFIAQTSIAEGNDKKLKTKQKAAPKLSALWNSVGHNFDFKQFCARLPFWRSGNRQEHEMEALPQFRHRSKFSQRAFTSFEGN